MRLPVSIRNALLEELETYIEAVDEPEIEPVVEYVLEQFQLAEDEFDLEDIAGTLEDEAGLDASLQECFEEALESRDDFVFTAEEVVSVLEQLTGIEWVDDEEYAEDA